MSLATAGKSLLLTEIVAAFLLIVPLFLLAEEDAELPL